MRLFDKLKIKIKNKNLIQFKIFNFTIFQYKKSIDKNFYDFKIFPANNTFIRKDVPFFYLKVNNNSSYSLKALRHWIDIVHHLDGDFVIICDKQKLKRCILKNVEFYDENIKFIKSIKRPLARIVKEIITGFWANAAYAHLTTIFHAQDNGIKEFWNIDADDTIIAAEPQKVAKLLSSAANYAQENDISLFSYDMWRSRTRSKAWTFGVTYTRNVKELIDLFNIANKKWQKDYLDCDQALNIDWYCTYLKDNNFSKIETFYTPNCYFLHTGDFLFDPVGKFISYVQNNVVHYPLIYNLFDDYQLGKISVAKECINIETDINFEESIRFMKSLLSYNDANFPHLLKKLWKIDIASDNSEKVPARCSK